MLRFDIPGRDGVVEIEHLVLDVNGTIAHDGAAISGVAEEIAELVAAGIHVVAITADTHGGAQDLRESLGVDVKIIDPGGEDEQKTAYVRWLGEQRVVAVGNGANDEGMLRAAAVGICVIGREGASGRAVAAADIVVNDIATAFGLLRSPTRLAATLRR